MKASSSTGPTGWTRRFSALDDGLWARLGASLGLALFAGVLLAGPADQPSVAKPASLSFSLQQEAGRLDVNYKGKRLLQYAFATNQFKPYVKELDTLQGDNVLLDSPSDHLHHHGLMYAIRVNGINFWEEATDPGVQKPVGRLACEVLSAKDSPGARISQTIHWVASKDRGLSDTTPAALLIEHRELTLTVNETAAEVALSWQGRFEVGKGAPKVTLAGASYHGLGMRFPRHWDHVAQHQNSAGLPYSAEQKGDVTTALWSMVQHTVNGHDISVAVLAPPGNAGTARFFTMLDAFAYVSATQDLEKTPLEYATGERFNLNYLVLVYANRRSRDDIQKRYER